MRSEKFVEVCAGLAFLMAGLSCLGLMVLACVETLT